MGNMFRLPPLDKPVYKLLQGLRVAHDNATQREVIQAALVTFGRFPEPEREHYLSLVRRAPSEQPEVYSILP